MPLYAIEALTAHLGKGPPGSITAIGGGARNRLLMQIKATVLNRTITVADVDEAAALGAAILGGLGAGVYTDVPSALNGLRYTRTPVEPVADQVDVYEAWYHQAYRQVYPALRSLHHNIDRIQREA